jgi:hypothetical protein
MNMLADDDLDDEDDDLDPHDLPSRDLSRPIRRLATAVLEQAVLDSRLQVDCHRHDTARFLYPQHDSSIPSQNPPENTCGAWLSSQDPSPAWLGERLARCANSTASKTRKCPKCKTVLSVPIGIGKYHDVQNTR